MLPTKSASDGSSLRTSVVAAKVDQLLAGAFSLLTSLNQASSHACSPLTRITRWQKASAISPGKSSTPHAPSRILEANHISGFPSHATTRRHYVYCTGSTARSD